jgi:hypothetical protein
MQLSPIRRDQFLERRLVARPRAAESSRFAI